MKFNRLISLLCLIVLLLVNPIRPLEASNYPVRAPHGIVASPNEIAAGIGVDILKRGGNAIDAAVAVGMALAVSYPVAGNIGGGGFMLIRTADGKSIAIDYRETAPEAASRNMYLGKDGNVIPNSSLVGYRAAGVPGTIAGFALALEKYGTMKWKDVLEPAYKVAADGFTVNRYLADGLRIFGKTFEQFPESRRIFLRDGKFYEEGEIFKQPELAATLQRLMENGPREFYEGRTAELTAEDMKTNGGIITLEDLKNYKAVVREPLKGTYRGYEIVAFPPPSSGGAAVIEMLNMLEHYDIAAMGHQSSEKCHLMIEAMRRAFADRAEYMGDPGFVDIPLNDLISKRYAANLLRSIDLAKASPSESIKLESPSAHESKETTHYTIIDAAGNAVSNTFTLNSGFGSCATVRGAGYLLNNEMDDFASKPGSPNQFGLIQKEANAIAPRKRPLSSMTPTIVVKDGKTFFAIGSPGGPTVINSMLQVIVNIIDHGMNIQQAINAPRLHHQWMPDEIDYEPFSIARDVMDALKAKGHKFSDRPLYMGDVEGALIDPKTGMRFGASDPRNPEAFSAGY